MLLPSFVIRIRSILFENSSFRIPETPLVFRYGKSVDFPVYETHSVSNI